jgi:hypothetical protein
MKSRGGGSTGHSFLACCSGTRDMMTMTELRNHKFIFLCGLHRSGTTPLFRILRSHPQISGFGNTGVPEDEGQHLQTVYPPARQFGGPGQFGFAAAAHLTEGSGLCTPANAERLFQQWSPHWNLNREFLVEKSPPNLVRTRFLQACFPYSYFITIIRHPIAVSLATLKWSRSRIKSLLEHWLVCHRLFDADCQHLQRVLVIRYEDLISGPELVLDKVRVFLGLGSPMAGKLDRNGNERYFAVWQQFQKSADGQVVTSDLAEKYESSFRDYGYSLRDCSVLFPSERVPSRSIHSYPNNCLTERAQV